MCRRPGSSPALAAPSGLEPGLTTLGGACPRSLLPAEGSARPAGCWAAACVSLCGWRACSLNSPASASRADSPVLARVGRPGSPRPTVGGGLCWRPPASLPSLGHRLPSRLSVPPCISCPTAPSAPDGAPGWELAPTALALGVMGVRSLWKPSARASASCPPRPPWPPRPFATGPLDPCPPPPAATLASRPTRQAAVWCGGRPCAGLGAYQRLEMMQMACWRAGVYSASLGSFCSSTCAGAEPGCRSSQAHPSRHQV